MKTARPKKRAKPLKIEWLIQQPLWKILAIAITDMRKQERAPRSRIDMDEWFRTNGECVACAAGSVLRWSFGAESRDEFWEIASGTSLRHAIDRLRSGLISSALFYLDRQQTIKHDCYIRSYANCREGFWRDIRDLQKRLRAANI